MATQANVILFAQHESSLLFFANKKQQFSVLLWEYRKTDPQKGNSGVCVCILD
jgi:hypothetical protein